MEKYEYIDKESLEYILDHIKKYIDLRIALIINDKLGVSTTVDNNNKLVTSAAVKEYVDKKIEELNSQYNLRY